MIDAIKIIEVMMGSLVTIYTEVFSLDYKREDECMFISPLHSETQSLNDYVFFLFELILASKYGSNLKYTLLFW